MKKIKIMSFGYRYKPPEANIISSVFKLPNPHHLNQLKNFTGLNKKVSKYVINSRRGKKYIERTLEYINNELKNKSELFIAIGCVGGKHRSVAVVCELAKLLEDKNREIIVIHRDIDKNNG